MVVYCFSCKNKIDLSSQDLTTIKNRSIDGLKLKPMIYIECLKKTQSQVIVNRRLYLNLDCDKRRY